MNIEEAIKNLKVLIGLEEFNKLSYKENKSIETLLTAYEKQSKEIEEYKKQLDLDNECEIALNSKVMDLEKEIEELKEKNNPQPDCEEPIERTEEMVNMKWVNHNYILKTESEQKERKAYIKGTNDADELCNKKWKDKIKAKIEELDDLNSPFAQRVIKGKEVYLTEMVQNILRELLEKE